MAMGWDDEFGEAVRAEEPLQARGRDRRWGEIETDGNFLPGKVWSLIHRPWRSVASDVKGWHWVVDSGKVIMRCRSVPAVVLPPGG